MKFNLQHWLSIYLLVYITLFTSCNKDKSPTPDDSKTNKVLVIKSSGIAMEVGGTYQLNVVWVDKNGNESPATGVSFTSSATTVANVNATGLVSGVAPGAAFVVAQITQSGVTYTARVPVSISARPTQGGQGLGSGQLPFVVAPATIVWWSADPNKNLQMAWVYLGPGVISNPTFTSSNPSVATVSSTGLITFTGAGEAVITVSASAGATNFVQQIPVLVVGTPVVPLPITRIEISPAIQKLFMDGEHTFTAKAYNSNNQEVNNISFAWEIEDADPDTIDGQIIKGATVDQTGKVKGVRPSVVKVKATANGISGSATVMVFPDGFYTISPYTQFVSPGQNVNLSAQYYEFNRSTFEPEMKPWPTSSQWKTLSDLVSIPGIPMPRLGTITSSSANNAIFKVSTDPFSLFPGMFEVIFVGQLLNPRIEPGASILTLAP